MKRPTSFKPRYLLVLVALAWFAGGSHFKPRPQPAPARENPPAATAVAEKPHAFDGFSRWLETFATAQPDQHPALAAGGLAFARERRKSMEALIQSDPQQALEQAVTLDVWKKLPPELQAEVEEPFSAIANFRVLPVCNADTPGAPDATRLTEIDGHPPLVSFVYGRREALFTKEKSPVQGIRLGNLAALHEGVFHELTSGEIPVAEATYPVANPEPALDFGSGQPLGKDPVTALAGGQLFKFTDSESLEDFEKSIARLDEKPGPHGGAAILFLPKSADGSAGFDLGGATRLNNEMASAWTETKKKVFMIRCDFTDKPNASFPVVNAGTYGALLNTTVSDNIRDGSYGKTWIEATVSADITTLPQPATYYDDDIGGGNTRNDQILIDAKAAYQTAHPAFVPSNYDIIGIWFVSIGMKGSGVTYAGLAGGGDLWIQGTSDAAVHVHEFGHNYGLGHSSFWIPPVGSTNPVDPAGASEQYGDVFDVMGDGEVPEGVFHSEAKQRLNWLATGQWTDATAGGNATYRINRIDHKDTGGVRGLRVTRAADDYFWLSYRRLFSNNWLKAGANIVWKKSGQSRSWLIDTTPGSLAGSTDRTDGALAIGRTFSDGNNHITPLARGGTSPNEYLDVQVNTGPFPGNVAPTATLAGPSTITARQTAIFTASATDGNGDALAYFWDFGQGFTFDNNPSVAFAWNSGGTYTVKVTVSDMKGNTVQATKVVTVTDPITTWSDRPNSSVGDFNALAASPTKVIAVGDSDQGSPFKGPIATSADGITWTSSQLGQNQHAYSAIWDGSQFLLAGMEYDFGPVDDFVGCVFTSPTANAGTWTRRIFTGSPLKGLAFGGGVYVAVGENGIIQRSTNGTSWSPVTSGTTNTLASVAYGGGKFVAVGYATAGSGDPTVLTSSDGTAWTNTSSGAGVLSWQDLRYINWAGDRFLASGFYGKVRQSTDLGVSFTTTRTAAEETPALAYGNGVWFAAGIDRDNAGADIDLVSTDGSNWSALATPSLDDRNAAIFFNNTFITAGKNHSIRQSATISAASVGYTAWRESYFPDHGPLTTPDADNDTDGSSNLLEYSLARSPSSNSGNDGPAALPLAVIVSSEPLLSDRIALEINLPDPAQADLIHIVEASSALDGTWTPLATKTGAGAWTWNPGGTSRIVSGTPADGRVIVKIGDSVPIAGNPQRFLRLRTQVNQ